MMANCSCDKCPVTQASRPERPHLIRRVPFAVWVFLAVATFTLIHDVMDARAEVYHSRVSALQLAFPAADSVTTTTLMFSEADAEEVAERAGAALESRLVRVYEAWCDGQVTHRGIIDTHKVRSLPETVMVVTDTDHRVEGVHLLAFHEPVQYRASDKWFLQFDDRRLDPELAVRRGIVGMAGATMTSNAVAAAVRRSLAALEVGFGDPDPGVGIGK
ncbi:MAG: FMN-binding protein [Gemmatimonadetes bacterium]|nr:FMN-binding protein [Gemmatimonadota bacterium]